MIEIRSWLRFLLRISTNGELSADFVNWSMLCDLVLYCDVYFLPGITLTPVQTILGGVKDKNQYQFLEALSWSLLFLVLGDDPFDLLNSGLLNWYCWSSTGSLNVRFITNESGTIWIFGFFFVFMSSFEEIFGYN